MFNFSDILFLLVLFLLLFISIFLFTSDNGKHVSNVLIGSFFLALFLNLADSFLLLKQVYFSYPSWAGWGSNLLLACGPLIFLYTQSILYKDFHFTAKKLIHFIPFVVLFLLTEVSYLSTSNQQKILILNSIIERKIPDFIYFISSIIYIHFLTYLFFSLSSIKKYELAAVNHFSETKMVTLGWLKTTIWFFLALVLISAVNSYLSFMAFKQVYFILFSTIVSLLLLFIIFVLFKALRNPEIFSALEEKEIEDTILPIKYASFSIQTSEKKMVLEKLQAHMQMAKSYLEPELSLNDLATQLSVKPKTLSQVINELLNQNFFEFINHYRIEEAKRLLTNPKDKKVTVLEVMYEVGFNSKSSFNTLFKKQTGFTPSEFKKKYLE